MSAETGPLKPVRLFTLRRQDHHWVTVAARTEDEALEMAKDIDVKTDPKVYTHPGHWWAQWDPEEYQKEYGQDRLAK